MSIHNHAAQGDIALLEADLANGCSVEARDEQGLTPLMVAVASPKADTRILRILLAYGADVNALSDPKEMPKLDEEAIAVLKESGIDTSIYDGSDHVSIVESVLSHAAKAATVDKIIVLLEAGADVRYVNANGYSVLINAMYRSCVESAEDHRAVIRTLIEAGAPLDAVSSYGESAIGVASYRGDFAIVSLLLERGADPGSLEWAPLFFEVAAGDLKAVVHLVKEGAALGQRDSLGRTPFLLAVHAGHRKVAEFLLERGSDRSATGRGGSTALMYAISRGDVAMLEWLIAMGWDVEQADDFGNSPIIEAAQQGHAACVEVLLDAGASLDRRNECGERAIKVASSAEVVRSLAAAGEDLSEIDSEMRAQLLHGDSDHEVDVSEEDYHRHRHRMFGNQNPERMNNPLWDALVRTRVSAYACAARYGDSGCGHDPVWCFDRFGQSLTELPDRRYVEIGGEHEDYYDPDFCIYNDVVVHRGDGQFDLFGYPEGVFPPTDFHSATLMWPHIYVIGNLGYQEQRKARETPVYRLNCETWAIERIPCQGRAPGWIHRHRARLVEDRQIVIRSGLIQEASTGNLIENTCVFVLELSTFRWRRER
jgi:ankyrin repeat protein